MKTLTHLLMAIIVSTWSSAIAIFSIQNVRPVSLQFFGLATIQLPIGVLLAFCAAGGVMLGALLPFLFPKPKRRRGRADELDDFNFDFD